MSGHAHKSDTLAFGEATWRRDVVESTPSGAHGTLAVWGGVLARGAPRKRKYQKARLRQMGGNDTTKGIHSEFLRTASAIVKQNALFRARYPRTDPIYCKVERSISGAFWDMPVQLHVFWDAIEKAFSWEEHQEFARQLERAVLDARRAAEKPKRGRGGRILWKRSVPLAGFALTDEIEAAARVFFESVYSQCAADRPFLSGHEKAFWERHRRLRRAVSRAKRDREDVYQLLLCLRSRLPNEICNNVILLLV